VFASAGPWLQDLTKFILEHFRSIRAQGKLDEPEYYFLKQYSEALDENDELLTDDNIATTVRGCSFTRV
jgi:hypothetical protein